MVRAGTVPYRRAWAWQRALVERRAADAIPDTVLLLEHPHVYTIGKRGSDADVLADPAWLTANGAEVVRSDRGGQVTYHGPGQLVGYPITRLDPSPDIWRFVGRVEQALVEVAAAFGLEARGERGDLTGVWVGQAKLGAIGMRVSRGVTSHGFALNCATDLAYFNAIVPCGMPDRGRLLAVQPARAPGAGGRGPPGGRAPAGRAPGAHPDPGRPRYPGPAGGGLRPGDRPCLSP